MRLLTKGEYDATVVKAEETVSKTSGNEMIAITLKVWNADGSGVLVNDYLLSTETGILKLCQFCEAAGLLDIYNQGILSASDCMDSNVKVKIKIDEGKGDFPAKNAVAAYVVPKAPKREPAGTGYSGSQVANVNRQLEESSDGDDTPF